LFVTYKLSILHPQFFKDLEVAKTLSELHLALNRMNSGGKRVALVPTMGALHQGHLSLINKAFEHADVVVCSIFVNPTQFTDPKDLEKYPRPLEHDLKLLSEAGCDLVFMPGVKDMYPSFPVSEDWKIDLGPAEFVLEGEFRKGHYQGVTQIVYKLFDAVKPHVALFGQKDFQQVLMIRNMVESLKIPVEIVTCPIIRDEDGLAMSSRNIHLSEQDRQNALVLSKALFYLQANYTNKSLADLMANAKQFFIGLPNVELEYLCIANTESLLPVSEKTDHNTIALVAARVGNTRLIDNVLLN
jgi:pantoate--beta-alanine ligase